MKFGTKKIPALFWILSIAYLAYCFLSTPNFLISIPVVLFPLFAYRFLWVDNFPNVLFFGMILQWMTAATQLLYSNFLQITLAEKMKSSVVPGEMMDMATLLNILGLYAFSVGLFLAVRKLKLQSIENIMERYSALKVLILYVSISILIFATSRLIWQFSSIVQFITFFFYIKWGFFVVVFYLVHKKAAFLRVYFYLFILFELSLGIVSFFAGSIMNLIVFTFLSVVLLRPKLTMINYVVGTVLLVITIHFLILWSAVKQDYRSYISQGKRVQSVLVSPELARNKFFDLMGDVSADNYQKGIEQLVDRLGYIQFFAASLKHVPKKVPYQNGAIYLSALKHFLVPRFLDPNKETLDDSKHTEKFTGIKLSGRKKASSFSLGYIADAYVDFGKYGMFIMLLIVGYGFGFFYSFLLKPSPNSFWVWVFTSPFLLLMNINGADTKKALGWVILYFVTVALFQNRIIKTIDPLVRV